MKEIIAVMFGLGLIGNAILFIPQALAIWRKKTDEGVSLITFGGFSLLQIVSIIHGLYQHDPAMVIVMGSSLFTCGTVTGLTIYYRIERLRG